MSNPNILQIGLGGFGKNHLRAWHELGLGQNLFIAELDPNRYGECSTYNMPPDRIGPDYRTFLNKVDVVDIVTPSTSHFEICVAALQAGKDVFVEKPMTMTSKEARKLADLVALSSKVLQVGYYYRFHPVCQSLKTLIDSGKLGDIRYISGNFMGFKRARTDVGVTHTDGIHFIDLFNWFAAKPPRQVYAMVRDHFERGMEDMSIILLDYPDGSLAKVESGYIQPGKWKDKVVPNAFTSKEFYVCGSLATAEIDLETESLTIHDIHQEFLNKTWTPVIKGINVPVLSTATPVQMIAAELKDFLDCVNTRQQPSANVVSSGLVLARIMEAVYKSALKSMPVPLSWNTEEQESMVKKP